MPLSFRASYCFSFLTLGRLSPGMAHLLSSVQSWPRARASSARPIFERPGRARRFASSYSSCRVFGLVPPRRLRRATAAPCLPSAVRVLAGMLAIDRFFSAPARALRTLRFAACTCLVVAIGNLHVARAHTTGAAGLEQPVELRR